MSGSDLSTAVWDVDADAFPADAPIEDRVRFLLRYAILAPSSHNSQPWSFGLSGDTVDIYADESRWLEVADADRRELYISLGCSVENLLIAATRFGFGSTVEYDPDESDVVVSVRLDSSVDPDRSEDEALFEAITDRRTSHQVFEDRPLPASTLDHLRTLVREDGIDLLLIDDEARKGTIAELQVEADERQMADPAYRRELGHWIGIGALGASWLMARIGQVAVTYLDLGEREGAKNSKLIESAPVVAVLTTVDDTVETRVRTGQVFERLMLATTLEEVAVHSMSQILEQPNLKRELASELDITDSIPQHLFRLGYATDGSDGTHTPRWPVTTVLRYDE